jgi:hypothetical protein
MNAPVPLDKLAAVLGMLGSEHHREALNAARLAERLRREARVNGTDLSAPDYGFGRDWRAKVAECRNHPDRLTAWEADFLMSLSRSCRLSEKQLSVLEHSAREVRGA